MLKYVATFLLLFVASPAHAVLLVTHDPAGDPTTSPVSISVSFSDPTDWEFDGTDDEAWCVFVYDDEPLANEYYSSVVLIGDTSETFEFTLPNGNYTVSLQGLADSLDNCNDYSGVGGQSIIDSFVIETAESCESGDMIADAICDSRETIVSESTDVVTDNATPIFMVFAGLASLGIVRRVFTTFIGRPT